MYRYFRVALVGAAALICSSVHAHGGGSKAEAGNPVTRWNAVAIEVLPVEPGLVQDSRAFAILHAAIHDAVNGIERRYQPYTADLKVPSASVDAAVAAASREVLITLAPSRATTVEIAYAATLLGVPDGAAKTAGVKLGQDAAKANLARRVGDGADTSTSPPYVPTGKPGNYAFTPPFDQAPFGPAALFPSWGGVAPFAIDLAEHELPPPLPLNSERYARDFNLLKSIGRHDSKMRTAHQTDTAMFWFEFSPMGWNRIANTLVRQERLDVWRSARVMALVNFALADGYIAGFKAKYKYSFWRPVTAIRNAANDGNSATVADPNWISLQAPAFFIPPVPDYPSTHTVLGAAASEVLIQNFGDRVKFNVISTTLPGAVREYRYISDAAHENGMSRVYGGIHFLNAVKAGCGQGKSIGQAVSRLLPRADRAISNETQGVTRSRLCTQGLEP